MAISLCIFRKYRRLFFQIYAQKCKLFIFLSNKDKHNTMKRSIALLLLLGWLIAAAAPAPYFRHLGSRDGLAHPSVLSIAQDSLGRLWFGTENGVSTYDGNRMTSFRSGSVVMDLVCDKEGNVCFLSNGELYRTSAGSRETTLYAPGPYNALFIWEGRACVLSGREVWQQGANGLVHTEDLPLDQVRKMLVTRDGTRWYINPEGLFRQQRGKPPVRVDPAPDRYGIFEDSRGEIWSGSRRNGLLRVFPDGTIRHYGAKEGLGSENIRGVSEDRQGTLWVGSFHGLCRFDPSTDHFSRYSREEREGGLTHSSIFAVFADRDGILWTGTYYSGVNYTDIRPGALTFYPASESENGLSYPIVGHLEEGMDASVWICTEGGGVNRLDPRSGRIRQWGHQPFTNAKWLLQNAKNGMVYIATNQEGLFRLDPVSGKFTRIIEVEGPDSPMAVINVIAQYGNELILSTDDGVFRFNGKQPPRLLYPKTDGVRYAHIAVEGDRLWIASSRVIAYDLRQNGIVAEYPLEQEGEWIRPMRILPSGDGLFISTFSHGLFRLGEHGFLPFGETAQLNGYQMVRCPDGGFVVSADDGIHLLSPDGVPVKTWLRGKNLPLEALVMDSGLLVTEDGTVYAGGTNGLVSFRMDSPWDDQRKNLYYSELYIDGNPLADFRESVQLKGTQERVDLYFTSAHEISEFNWADYEYKIQGLDRGWTATEGPFITANHLQPGSYTFLVRRRGERENLCSLRMDIQPFWWATWWVKTALILAGILLLWMIVHVARLRRKSAREKELNETKLRFFTSASHELRTPLTLIIAQIDAIFQSFHLPPLVTHKMQQVKYQAGQMNQLVTELIDFRKYEQGLVRLDFQRVGLNSFLEETFEKFREIAEEKKLELQWTAAKTPPTVIADPYQLQKVLMNLVFNAVKFTPEGGRITLSCENASGGMVAIHVRDTGIGIAEEDLKHIFERFYQARGQEDVTQGLPGSGIGLALAKEIIERHSGTLEVRSELGKGSDFIIRLKEAPPKESERQELPNDKDRKTVVIAEDNPEMSSLLWELFSLHYHVHTASDGVEALEIIRKIHPDLIVSDVMMPRMDGKKLCTAVKGDRNLRDIPFVLLTALGDRDEELRGLQLGADDYIAKPFDSNSLLMRCANLILSRGTAPAEGPLSRRAVNPEDKVFLESLAKLIDDNLGDGSLDNDFLAEKMNMSRSSFYARFRKVTAQSPTGYINACRLKKAEEMLREHPEMSVAEIADSLGFNTQNYFCRRFKEQYGVPPTHYRKKF